MRLHWQRNKSEEHIFLFIGVGGVDQCQPVTRSTAMRVFSCNIAFCSGVRLPGEHVAPAYKTPQSGATLPCWAGHLPSLSIFTHTCKSSSKQEQNVFVSGFSSHKANIHIGFGALDLYTLSLLLELFDAFCLIRHGIPWSWTLRCGRTPCRRFESLRHKLVLQNEPRIGKTWFPVGSILSNEAHGIRELYER
jgi:hypothetical protein